MHDLIVVGGGPAGLGTALYAARSGLDVVVIEPRAAPIDKACGEGLMPGAVRPLIRLGVVLSGYPFTGIRYLDSRHSVETLFRDGTGLGVRRIALHDALMAQVDTVQIPVLKRRVDDVTQHADCVSVAGLRSRYLAAADGLHSTVRRLLGLASAHPTARPRWGQRQHFAVAPWTDRVEVHWSPDAEAYVTPVAADLVGVAMLSAVRRPFAAHLRHFPLLAERVGDRAVTDVLGAGPLRQRTARRVAGRVMFVGDASGYVDALTGEGIAVALGCAEALVECIVRDDPRAYERRWRQASRRYRSITSTLVWAVGHKRLRRAIVPTAALAPPVFGAIVRQLAR